MKRVNGIAKNNYKEVRREIADIYQENYGSYGYRRVTAETPSASRSPWAICLRSSTGRAFLE